MATKDLDYQVNPDEDDIHADELGWETPIVGDELDARSGRGWSKPLTEEQAKARGVRIAHNSDELNALTNRQFAMGQAERKGVLRPGAGMTQEMTSDAAKRMRARMDARNGGGAGSVRNDNLFTEKDVAALERLHRMRMERDRLQLERDRLQAAGAQQGAASVPAAGTASAESAPRNKTDATNKTNKTAKAEETKKATPESVPEETIEERYEGPYDGYAEEVERQRKELARYNAPKAGPISSAVSAPGTIDSRDAASEDDYAFAKASKEAEDAEAIRIQQEHDAAMQERLAAEREREMQPIYDDNEKKYSELQGKAEEEEVQKKTYRELAKNNLACTLRYILETSSDQNWSFVPINFFDELRENPIFQNLQGFYMTKDRSGKMKFSYDVIDPQTDNIKTEAISDKTAWELLSSTFGTKKAQELMPYYKDYEQQVAERAALNKERLSARTRSEELEEDFYARARKKFEDDAKPKKSKRDNTPVSAASAPGKIDTRERRHVKIKAELKDGQHVIVKGKEYIVRITSDGKRWVYPASAEKTGK